MAGTGLEIGPSHNPLLRKADGFDIRIADHLNAEGLRDKYEGIRPTGRIEGVDYVLAGGRLTQYIPDRFAYILASHVMEHTVCLISFLQDCEALLEPGGVLSLALPDRRYCFDRFRERTSLGRVIDVYRAAPLVHSEGSVLEHNLNLVNKGALTAWYDGAPGDYRFRYTRDVALERSSTAAAGSYVDTHNWVFTPQYFRLLMLDLHSLGFIGLQESSFQDTIGAEFFVTLTAAGDGPGMTREQLVCAAAAEAAMPEAVRFA